MQAFLDLCVVSLAWIMIGSFAWSMKKHFVAGTFPLGARLVSVAFFVCAIALTWTVLVADQPIAFLMAGLGFQAASCGLFWSAIAASRTARLRYVFDDGKPASLLTDGPYGRIRHPFYTSYLLFWVGWSLASASPWAAAIVAYFAFAYTAAAREEEQNFARSPLAEEYSRYRAMTGRFLPRMR